MQVRRNLLAPVFTNDGIYFALVAETRDVGGRAIVKVNAEDEDDVSCFVV